MCGLLHRLVVVGGGDYGSGSREYREMKINTYTQTERNGLKTPQKYALQISSIIDKVVLLACGILFLRLLYKCQNRFVKFVIKLRMV